MANKISRRSILHAGMAGPLLSPSFAGISRALGQERGAETNSTVGLTPISTSTSAFIPATEIAGILIAIKRKGFDAKAGISLDNQWTNAVQELITSTSAGHTDFAPNLFVEQWAAQRAKGAAVKIVATIGRAEAILIGKLDRPNLSTITGLKGTKIALSTASFAYGWLRYLAKEAGYDFDKEVRLVNIPWQQASVEVAVGNVDAGLVFEPDASLFLQQNPGYAGVLNISNEMEKVFKVDFLPTMVLGANEAWLDKYPDGAKRLLEMWRLAESFVNNQPDEFASLMAEPIKATNRNAGGMGVNKEHILNALRAKAIPGQKGFKFMVGPVDRYLNAYGTVLRIGQEAKVLTDIPDSKLYVTGLR